MESRKSLAVKRAKRVKRARRPKVTGYLLFEGKDVVVIATLKSGNIKTANMIQVWILHRWLSPIEAIKQGKDAVICLDCPHRGDFGKRTCYVDVSRAPMSIFRKYQRGGYALLAESDYARVFGARRVRFGAYGDPVLIPLGTLAAIARVAEGWTGYSHQWKLAQYQEYRAYLMASCDSAVDFELAHSMEWRTFRVRAEYEPLLAHEIKCPASPEGGHKSTCERCLLCNGSRGANDARKDIVIIVHGVGAKNFVPLTSILTVAA